MKGISVILDSALGQVHSGDRADAGFVVESFFIAGEIDPGLQEGSGIECVLFFFPFSSSKEPIKSVLRLPLRKACSIFEQRVQLFVMNICFEKYMFALAN